MWSAIVITVAVVSLGLVRAGFAASRAVSPPAGVLMREKRGCDAHLVQEGVAGEGKDRADLGLPSEPADSGLTADNIGQDQGLAGRLGGEHLLELGEVLEGLIGHGVDQAEAEQRGGAAPGHDVGFRRDCLADEVNAVE